MTEVADDESTGWSGGPEWPGVPAWCEHGPGAHDGTVPAAATAPVASRAWLLIEDQGPWAHSAIETALPSPLAELAADADRAGIRVQLIRRPLRSGGLDQGISAGSEARAADSEARAADSEARAADSEARAVYAAWTAGPRPWLTRMAGATAAGGGIDLAGVARGAAPVRAEEAGPLYLVCAHARRDRCCGRFGGPLARGLAARYPEQVWETTHLGGHKHAPNLALLPEGHYYGPADLPSALAAIEAYERGEVSPHRYRGRAGHDQAWQQAEQARVMADGTGPA